MISRDTCLAILDSIEYAIVFVDKDRNLLGFYEWFEPVGDAGGGDSRGEGATGSYAAT